MKLFKREKKNKITGRTTVREYMNDWLENVKKPVLKPSSYDRVEQSLKYQIYPFIGDIRIDKLRTDEIQKMVNSAAESSYSTAKKSYNNISSGLELAVRKGLINRNPAAAVVMPRKLDFKEVSCYTEEQIQAITEEATNTYKNGRYKYRYGYAIILLLNTGMRSGELTYLKWKDVDLVKRYIYVHGNVSSVKSRSGGGYELIEQETPKTSKSIRYITLNDNAVKALKKLKAIIGEDSVRVVETQNGNILSPRKIYSTMTSILERAEIERIPSPVHALRHTFATMLIRKGVDIKVISELLGHADVSTTMGIYYHTIEAQKREAVQQLEDFY